VLAVAAAEGALMFGVLAFAPSFLAQRHGFGTAGAGAAVALFGVGGLLYSRLAKCLLRRFGERGLAAGGGALVGASLLVLAWSSHWVAVLPACLLAGAGFYMLHATLQTQATQMAPARRGTAVAWFACLLFLGQSIGILGMSMAVDLDFAVQAISACGLGLAILGAVVARSVAAKASAAACPR
jgi:predicted MFS family arabinose efflux permease